MPAFAITAVGGFPPPTAEEFPQFLQWQDNGTDLGLPNVDTVNIVGDSASATRGTGANANTVTITVGAAGLFLLSSQTQQVSMNGTNLEWTVNDAFLESPDATWEPSTSQLLLVEPGTYEIVMNGRFAMNDPGFQEFPTGLTFYGSNIQGAEDIINFSRYTHTFVADTSDITELSWTDTFITQTLAGGLELVPVGIFVFNQNNQATQCGVAFTIAVRLISPAFASGGD